MQATICASTFEDLSFNDLLWVDGGAWSWTEFGRSTLSGAVGGGVAGAFGGTVTLPVIGTVSGWAGGAILGGLGGAAAYAVTGWW